MHRFCTLVIMLTLLVACGGEGQPAGSGEDELPTLAAPASVDDDSNTDGQSPRSGAAEEPPLPPTFTPVPRGERESVPTVVLELNAEGTPVPVPEAEGRETYTVQPGDTLGEIATRYGVTVEALADLNNIDDIDVIEVGDVLVIPDQP